MSAHTSGPADPNKNNKNTQIEKNDTLVSSTSRYVVIDFIGQGCFGKVAKCINSLTDKNVAVKIPKGDDDSAIRKEVQMLQVIRCLDPEKNNIVEFIEYFKFNNISCLAFEMLDRSLWHLMKERRWKPLSLNEIRPVVHQLLIAFDALKSLGIIHADLKLDNVMLVNHKDQPFRIKLIDFGLAKRVGKLEFGILLQPFSCRAPEVTLALPLTEAIDMWGVGCMMASLYFGKEIFPRKCEYNLMRCIVHLVGEPPDHIVSAGKYTWPFFTLKDRQKRRGWKMRTPEAYQKLTDIPAQLPSSWFFDKFENLEDAVRKYPAKKDDTEFRDRMTFLSLLKSILELDAERRVTPSEALKSTFLSMDHLENGEDSSSYRSEALQCMNVLPSNHVSLHEFNKLRGDLRREVEQKKLLQAAYEELQEAQKLSQEKFTAELHAEKERNKTLQEQLDQMTVSLSKVNLKYQTDVTDLRQQVDTFRADLESELEQKKVLKAAYEALQEAQQLSQKFSAELQAEKERNKTLQEQLDKLTVSLSEVNLKYETDVTDVKLLVDTLWADLERELEQEELVQTTYGELQEAQQLSQEMFSAREEERIETPEPDLDKIPTSECMISDIQTYGTDVITMTQQADTHQHELDTDIMSHADSVSEGWCVMAGKITTLQEKEDSFGRELDELQAQLCVQLTLNPNPSAELKAETEAETEAQKITIPNVEPLEPLEPLVGSGGSALYKEAELPEEMRCKQQEPISPAPSLESQRGAEGNPPQRTVEPPSAWKRVRHFLGLRKPKRWKKKKREEEN